jgi:DNA polymerase-3 subunit epsilon
VSNNQVFIAFDIETTGLLPGVDRIIELAGVAFQDDAVLSTFAQLLDPGIPIPREAGKVNGITDDMVKGMPTAAQTLPDFLAFLRRGTPVAHNAVFDVSFLQGDIEAAGIAAPVGPVLDTRGLARQAFPGRFSYSLTNLVKDMGLTVDGAHRALADAHACRLLFLLCMSRLGQGTAPGIDDLSRMSGAPLDFGQHAPRQARTAAALDQALRNGTTVEIAYRGAGGELTQRRIRPLSFGRVGGSVAVVAFCMMRNDKRTFRIDSILEVRAVQ